MVIIFAHPCYAANKIGFGLNFSREEDIEEEDNYNCAEYEDSTEYRLYYEHLLRQPLGIQLELGLTDIEYDYKNDCHGYDTQSYEKIDFSVLLKYYFYLKLLLDRWT